MDKTLVRKIRIEDEKSNFLYWVKQSVEARLSALETIRAEYNQWKYDDQQGFQSVYRIIKQQ